MRYEEVKRGCLFFLQPVVIRRRPSGNGKFLYESLNQKTGTDLLFVRLACFSKILPVLRFLAFRQPGPLIHAWGSLRGGQQFSEDGVMPMKNDVLEFFI